MFIPKESQGALLKRLRLWNIVELLPKRADGDAPTPKLVPWNMGEADNMFGESGMIVDEKLSVGGFNSLGTDPVVGPLPFSHERSSCEYLSVLLNPHTHTHQYVAHVS